MRFVRKWWNFFFKFVSVGVFSVFFLGLVVGPLYLMQFSPWFVMLYLLTAPMAAALVDEVYRS